MYISYYTKPIYKFHGRHEDKKKTRSARVKGVKQQQKSRLKFLLVSIRLPIRGSCNFPSEPGFDEKRYSLVWTMQPNYLPRITLRLSWGFVFQNAVAAAEILFAVPPALGNAKINSFGDKNIEAILSSAILTHARRCESCVLTCIRWNSLGQWHCFASSCTCSRNTMD